VIDLTGLLQGSYSSLIFVHLKLHVIYVNGGLSAFVADKSKLTDCLRDECAPNWDYGHSIYLYQLSCYFTSKLEALEDEKI
jgi:hypothetical protein